MTEYLRPRSIDEAVAMRAAHPEYMVLAGATDLMVDAKHKREPAGILDLWRTPGMVGITDTDARHRDRRGHDVARDPASRRDRGALDTARGRGARDRRAADPGARDARRQRRTSSPVGDSLPALLALDAELELASVRGARRVPYREFCTGYRKTALAADELIVAAHLPSPSAHARLAWRKVGTRRAQSISKVMGAAAIEWHSGVVVAARIALGAVADRPIRVHAVEAAVRGLVPHDAADAARRALRAAITPIDDIRSTSAYRREVAENLVARFFTDLT